MPIIFPPLDSASPEGLLAIGGNLDEETLLTAYTQGIFPWPISNESPLTWFSPDPRGILAVKDYHISKSFTKFLSNTKFEVRFNTQFEEVLKRCAKTKRKHEAGTWITEEITQGYCDFFEKGHSYSIEIYDQSKLVGGLYGVSIGKYISGESMFHTETNASKVALYALMSILKVNDIDWIDTQMVTPVIASMGGKSITRDNFLVELNKTIHEPITRDEIFNFNFSELNPLFC